MNLIFIKLSILLSAANTAVSTYDPTQNEAVKTVSEIINNIGLTLQVVALPVLGLVIIISGFMFKLGGAEGRGTAKKWLIFGLLGFILIAFGTVIARSIATASGAPVF